MKRLALLTCTVCLLFASAASAHRLSYRDARDETTIRIIEFYVYHEWTQTWDFDWCLRQHAHRYSCTASASGDVEKTAISPGGYEFTYTATKTCSIQYLVKLRGYFIGSRITHKKCGTD